MMRQEKSVSLSFELERIELATEAVRALLESARYGGIVHVDDHDATYDMAGAMLALIGTRIRDLDRVTRGTLPAERFWTKWNRALALSDEPDARDVRFGDASQRAKKRRKKA